MVSKELDIINVERNNIDRGIRVRGKRVIINNIIERMIEFEMVVRNKRVVKRIKEVRGGG